ncbi:hypothetical protein FRC09_008430 [Ceratobasidium sp. 395]|nr:hypothetical protein FRC09_008430 [Ceratobasidium sp. 395]
MGHNNHPTCVLARLDRVFQSATNLGANQAVAVAMSGSAVDFAGSVGTDGAWLKEFLKEHGVGTDLMIVHDGQPSGRAIIQTTPDGENEIRLSDTVDTLHAAHRQGVLSIFNPSPMLLPEELRSFPWGELSVLVVNEGEASTLLDALGERTKLPAFGGTAILDALASLPALSGISGIVVTLGGNGAVASFSAPGGRETFELPAAKVKVTDTTGAGDTFLGYLCGSLMRIPDLALSSSSLKLALQTSIVAAGLSTEKAGAMSSIPSKAEVDTRLAAYLE